MNKICLALMRSFILPVGITKISKSCLDKMMEYYKSDSSLIKLDYKNVLKHVSTEMEEPVYVLVIFVFDVDKVIIGFMLICDVFKLKILDAVKTSRQLPSF